MPPTANRNIEFHHASFDMTSGVRKTREVGLSQDIDSATTFVSHELYLVKHAVPPCELKACCPTIVQVEHKVGKPQEMKIKVFFPEGYPCMPLAVQLHSPRLDEELVAKLQAACDVEAKKNVGQMQVMPVLRLVDTFVNHNKLAFVYPEIRNIQKMIDGTCSRMQTLQSHGVVKLFLEQGLYNMALRILIPDDYPAGPAQLEVLRSTFPPEYVRVFTAHAVEVARRCAENGTDTLVPPPDVKERDRREGQRLAFLPTEDAGTAKQRKAEAAAAAKADAKVMGNDRKLHVLGIHGPHPTHCAPKVQKVVEPKPSLQPMVAYLLQECVQRLPTEVCLLCKQQLIPPEPSQLAHVKSSQQAERIYCGHYYHYSCLEDFLNKPPFGESKVFEQVVMCFQLSLGESVVLLVISFGIGYLLVHTYGPCYSI
mmetsp:Transcript_32374/g.60844  ORF Transcript_32374/g.60844 Transcript_32374/m.60844 type:complete len:425 (-) Transcript_32374:437-1711(-)